jgi:hypothetical protein
MKVNFCIVALLTGSSFAAAQSQLPASDPNLINLQTPSLLSKSQSAASLDLRYFGGYDKSLRGSLWYGFGICKDLEIDVAGSFAKWNTANYPDGNFIRFGGTDEELSLRYALPVSNLTVQGGLAYVQTPAQSHRIAATVGGSYGYSPIKQVRFYLNPKAVFLDRNSLVGIGLGTSIDLVHHISLLGDWTPLIAGDNTFYTADQSRSRGELYGVGLRFSNLYRNGTVDIGVTNSTGITTGSSLTPSLGDSPSLFGRLTYRF